MSSWLRRLTASPWIRETAGTGSRHRGDPATLRDGTAPKKSAWWCGGSPRRCRRRGSVCVTVTSDGSDPGSTAKPWFCDVISTLPDCSSLTGWLAPRCPNFSLNVWPPTASPRIWWPRQIPNIGASEVSTSSRTFVDGVRQRRRIAGAVAQEDAVRLDRHQRAGRRGGRERHGRRSRRRRAAAGCCTSRRSRRRRPAGAASRAPRAQCRTRR